MADNQITGLFDQFGIDSRSKEEILLEKKAQRFAAARDRGIATAPRFRSAAEQALFNLGNTAGAAIGGSRFLSKQPTLSDQESQRATAAASTQDIMKNMVGTPEWEGMEPEKKQEFFQSTLAGELAKAGDVTTGTQMFAQLREKQRARELQDKQLKKIGLGLDEAETKVEQSRFNLFEDKRGKHMDVYRRGTIVPMAAFIDPETGAAKMADGTEIPLGEYATAPDPTGSLAAKAAARGSGGSPINKSEGKEIRAQMAAVRAQMSAAKIMYSAMQQGVDATGTVDILDKSGAMTNWVVDMVDALKGAARNIKSSLELTDGSGKGMDLSNPGSAAKYARENAEELDLMIGPKVPARIRNNQVARERFYSALIQMTYAKARAQEPGARQLSDADFKNALETVAGGTGNPEALRQVLLDDISRSVGIFKENLMTLPDAVQRGDVIGSRAMEDLDAKFAEFQQNFGMDFGTAEEPGEGLTGVPEEVELTPEQQALIDKYSN